MARKRTCVGTVVSPIERNRADTLAPKGERSRGQDNSVPGTHSHTDLGGEQEPTTTQNGEMERDNRWDGSGVVVDTLQ